jgi:hypothetical protein
MDYNAKDLPKEEIPRKNSRIISKRISTPSINSEALSTDLAEFLSLIENR